LKALSRDFLSAFLSAALLVLAFPKNDLYLLAWVGLIPLLIALQGKSLSHSFALCFWMGISFMMGIFYWINVIENFTLMDFILLGIYQGIYFGLFGLGFSLVTAKTRLPAFVTAPCLWVAMEYFRSLGDFALPWAFLGYSQYLNLAMIQISAVTGVYGVSFLIVAVNLILSEIVLHYGNRRTAERKNSISALAVIGTGAVGLSLLYGLVVMKSMPPSHNMSIALIQANIAQAARWQPSFREQNFEKHAKLTMAAVKSARVSLIVWPETAVQGSMSQNKDELARFSDLARATGAYLLVGSAERPKFRSNEARTGAATASNTAFLIAPSGGIAGRYDKIRLLPFGEYLPFKQFPWPSRIASSWSAGEFRPGSRYTVFNLNDTQFAVTICWENIFPDLFRRFVKNGAKLMINITNEAWFEKTAAPYQLMAMSVFRAVENHVSIARAANTGISVFIDPVGRILSKVKRGNKDIFVDGYVVENVSVSSSNTFYTRYGDVFAALCTAVSFLFVFLTLVRARQEAALATKSSKRRQSEFA
jgi:apolipoprotein N-acyltransferase